MTLNADILRISSWELKHIIKHTSQTCIDSSFWNDVGLSTSFGCVIINWMCCGQKVCKRNPENLLSTARPIAVTGLILMSEKTDRFQLLCTYIYVWLVAVNALAITPHTIRIVVPFHGHVSQIHLLLVVNIPCVPVNIHVHVLLLVDSSENPGRGSSYIAKPVQTCIDFRNDFGLSASTGCAADNNCAK
jgi:hypothetical protein